MRISDWSSDVCSSDLPSRTARASAGKERPLRAGRRGDEHLDVRGRQPDDPGREGMGARNVDRPRHPLLDRKSVVEGKSVSVRVDLGGRRRIKNKKYNLSK